MADFYEHHCEKYYNDYKKREAFFRENPARIKALKIFGKLSTVIVYAAYILLLFYLLFKDPLRLIKVIAVPGVIFFAVTFVRSGLNMPRPYEKYDLVPLIPKATKGKSCPSRHSACAFAIAMACLYVNIPIGIAMLIIAAAITLSRPVIGVHFPLDAFFGAAMAVILAVIGFYIIP